jgi:hypothetical protein
LPRAGHAHIASPAGSDRSRWQRSSRTGTVCTIAIRRARSGSAALDAERGYDTLDIDPTPER